MKCALSGIFRKRYLRLKVNASGSDESDVTPARLSLMYIFVDLSLKDGLSAVIVHCVSVFCILNMVITN